MDKSRTKLFLPNTDCLPKFISRDIRAEARELYTQIGGFIQDPELIKLLDCEIDWSKYGYTSTYFRNSLIRSTTLSTSGFATRPLAPSSHEFVLRPEMHNKIKQFWLLRDRGLPISLLALICAQSPRCIYIEPGITVSDMRKINMSDNFYGDFLLVIVSSGARFSYHEAITGLTETTSVKSIYFWLEEGSELTFLGEYAHQSKLLSHISVIAHANARVTFKTVHMPGDLDLVFVDYTIDGEHVQVLHSDWASIKKQSKYACIVKQHHKKSGSQSDIRAKLLLQDSARGFYRGNIMIDKNASHSVAGQKQTALILGLKARTCAIPSLEVLNNQVNCSHGTATGRLSTDQIWYLQSRGLDNEHAKKLIIDGFFDAPQESSTVHYILDKLKQYTHE